MQEVNEYTSLLVFGFFYIDIYNKKKNIRFDILLSVEDIEAKRDRKSQNDFGNLDN